MFLGVVIVYISVSDGSLVFQQAAPRVSQKYVMCFSHCIWWRWTRWQALIANLHLSSLLRDASLCQGLCLQREEVGKRRETRRGRVLLHCTHRNKAWTLRTWPVSGWIQWHPGQLVRVRSVLGRLVRRVKKEIKDGLEKMRRKKPSDIW